MTRKQETRAIIAILSFSIVLMGIVAAASGLAVMNAHFSNVSQTRIQMIISLPSIIIIFATIAAGKLQEYISKKTVLMIGLVLFFTAGIAPTFMKNFNAILISRVFFGVGIGFLQPMSSAIVSYYFEGEKRDKIMGWQSAAQQVGASAMSMTGALLADCSWNLTFLTHGFAIFGIILVPIFLPKMKSARKDAAERGEKPKVTITKGALLWTGAEFFFFLVSQVNAIYNSYLIAEKQLGTPSDLGLGYLFSCIMGFLTGFFFSRIRKRFGRYTYALALFCLALGDFIVAMAPNITVFYISHIFTSMAFGIAVPVMIVGISSSVDKFSNAMAMAIAMSAKSIAQFFCANVFTTLADGFVKTVGLYGRNQWVYIICSTILCVSSLLIALCCFLRNKREKTLRART